MDKKRSTGITLFAWLLISSGAFALFSSFDFKTYFGVFRSLHKSLVVLIISYSILSAIAGIIAGIGLLKLKEIMRKVGIAINAIDLLFGMPLFFISLNDIRQFSYSIATSRVINIQGNLNAYLIANFTFYLVVFLIFMTFALSFLFIFFFTRPKIKEQFK